MLKKPNGLPAPLTTNDATMTIVKTGATTIVTAIMMSATAAMTMTASKMTASPDMTTTRIAREAYKAGVAGLITPSTPSTLMPSAPTMLISASC